MKKIDDRIVGVYKGDNFITVGTKEEVSIELGIKIETINWSLTPSAKKRLEEVRKRKTRKQEERFDFFYLDFKEYDEVVC